MTPLRLIPLLATALVALLFTSAAGANTVTIATGNNKTFNPTIVNIAPGDTVQWNWVGPDTNHSPASNESVLEPFDANPGNPNPNFNHPLGVNLSHTFTHSGSFAFHCKVHPDIMRGTVNVSGAPAPAFTSSPSPAFVGDDVAFDGSTSSDPDGSIAKFEWDFGGGFAEGAQTEHHTYLSTGTFTVKLRVTDDRGNVREVSHPITIATRAPSASFSASPSPAAKGQAVSFDASASAPTSGRSIASYEWDLDGDGTFETNTGTTPSASSSYTAAGTKTIGLRVTDDHADAATTTRSLTISNAAPVAAFTASTTTPAFGGTVAFDGAGSSDPDGTIANYKWDLDGDGTFETDTGATTTASHAYSSSGPVSVKLQVTDNEGGTNTATVSITVGAAPSSSPPPSSSPAPAPAPAPPAAAAPAPAPPAGPAGPAVAAVVKPAVTTPAPAQPKPAAKKKAKAKKCPKGKKRNKKGKCVKAKKK